MKKSTSERIKTFQKISFGSHYPSPWSPHGWCAPGSRKTSFLDQYSWKFAVKLELKLHILTSIIFLPCDHQRLSFPPSGCFRPFCFFQVQTTTKMIPIYQKCIQICIQVIQIFVFEVRLVELSREPPLWKLCFCSFLSRESITHIKNSFKKRKY